MWGFWELWGSRGCERRGFLRLGASRRPARSDVRGISGIRGMEQSGPRGKPKPGRGIWESSVSKTPGGRPPWGVWGAGGSGRFRGLRDTGRPAAPAHSGASLVRTVRTQEGPEPLRRPEGSGDSAVEAMEGFGDWGDFGSGESADREIGPSTPESKGRQKAPIRRGGEKEKWLGTRKKESKKRRTSKNSERRPSSPHSPAKLSRLFGSGTIIPKRRQSFGSRIIVS